MRRDRRRGPILGVFWWSLVVFAGTWIFLEHAFPHLAQWIADSANPLPIPSAAMAMYLGLTLVGIGVYAFSTDRLMHQFLRPPMLLLKGEGGSAVRFLRWAVLVLFPLLFAYGVYAGMVPSAQAPIESRIQHPTIPGRFERLHNPFRNPTEGEVKAFIQRARLGDVDLEAARRRLVQEYTREGLILYQKNCRPCHGTKADGTGPMAEGFRLRPADFTDSGTIATLVEAYLFWRIQEGGIGLPNEASPWDSAMPRWKDDLTDDEIWKIILAEYDIAGVEPRIPEKTE
ncbi:MAG: c-type cytochrome [Nitrospinota bacterium]